MIVATEKRTRHRRRLPVRIPATQRVPLSDHHLAVIPTGWGVCGVVWKLQHDTLQRSHSGFLERRSEAVLCQIMTPGLSIDELRKTLLAKYSRCSEVLANRAGNFHPEVVPTWFPELARLLNAYYTTSLRARMAPDFTDSWRFWRVILDWSQLTPFQKSVLEITATIPRGQRRTYGQVAKQLGKPQASRAVGAALGANPWPVLVPCHRVVGANGSMTGFSAPGGIGAKQRMLSIESSAAATEISV